MIRIMIIMIIMIYNDYCGGVAEWFVSNLGRSTRVGSNPRRRNH